MNKKRYRLYMCIMIAIIACLCVGLSILIILYLSNDNSGELGTRPVFTYKVSDDIELGEFDYSNDILAYDSGTINISLTTDEGVDTTCNYNILWVWDENLNMNSQYHLFDDSKVEFAISGHSDDDSFEGVQVKSYIPDNFETILAEKSISVNGNEIATQSWTIEANFYKFDGVDHLGKKYPGHLDINNVVCSSLDK